MGIRRIRSESGMPIEDVKRSADPVQAIKELYEYGRQYPLGRPHDYPVAKGIPHPQPSGPSWESERASYRQPTRVPPVSPAVDESAVQFQNDKLAAHNDVPVSDWTRGGDCSHPHFDHGKSGDRFRK